MRKVLLLFTLIVIIGIGIGTWYILTNLDSIVKADTNDDDECEK